jgi:hypothetical protein
MGRGSRQSGYKGMTVRARFRREAEADVLEALAWYRERGSELGEAFL